MKVLLIQPRRRAYIGLGGVSITEPLALEMVASPLMKDGHDVMLLDLLDPRDLEFTLKRFAPDVCGVSCSFTVDVYQTLSIASRVKRAMPRCLVVIGGHHATLNPGDFKSPAVDAVVLGEGEFAFAEFVHRLDSGAELESLPGLALNRGHRQVITSGPAPIPDLNSLPLPRRDLSRRWRGLYHLGLQVPLATLQTTRGCPHRCRFCSVWNFYGPRVRYQEPPRVLEEIQDIREPYILFNDDNFFANVSRAYELAELVRKSGIKKQFTIQARSDNVARHPDLVKAWKDIGLRYVFIGFEKVEDQELDELKKGNSARNNEKALEILKSLGVGVIASFIVDPWAEKLDFEKLKDYVRRLKIRTPSFAILTPLPGTELYKELREGITTKNYELFDMIHAVLPTRLSLPEFYKEMVGLYKSAYATPEYLIKSVLHLLTKLLWGRLSLFHFHRLVSVARMFTNPACYLAPHKLEACES